MSNKTKSLVFGYVRNNYRFNVPEAIIKMCLFFFDPEVILAFKGKNLQKFLDPQNTQCRTFEFKFNQNLAFKFSIHPNVKSQRIEKYVVELLEGFMTDKDDYFAICYQVLCVETQSIIASSHRFMDSINNAFASHEALTLSECKKHKELTFVFIIRSLEIRYKKKNDPLFYPSLNARMLKQETSLNWNIDAKRIKNCAKRQAFLSEIMDNWSFRCCPNGFNDEFPEGMVVDICLMSWPLEISQMVITIKQRIIVNSEVVDEDEWNGQLTSDDYKQNRLGFCMLRGYEM